MQSMRRSIDLFVTAISTALLLAVALPAAAQQPALVCSTLSAEGFANAQAAASVSSPTCPAGTVLTGGGFREIPLFSKAALLRSSGPNAANDGWECEFLNDAPSGPFPLPTSGA